MGVESGYRKTFRRFETGSPRFVTFSTHRRLPLFHDDGLKDLFRDGLAVAHARGGFRLFAWVLMPEHVHLVLHPSRGVTMPRVLVSIKQPVAQRAVKRFRTREASVLKELVVRDGRVRFWQAGGGFDRNVRTMEKLRDEIRYVHENPVRRGLVERAEDWAWSSARWWAGAREGELVMDPIR